MFATINPTSVNADVLGQAALQNLTSNFNDDSFIVSRDGALATFYKTYNELGIPANDTNFRWNTLDAFLRSEAIQCSEVKVGVCGLIVFASIPGTQSSGSVYWFHEPTRSVLSITFDEYDCHEDGSFNTGAHFDLKEFECLYEAHNLGRLTGSSAIPAATPKQITSLALDELPIAA
jgi:hypothetical protein